MSVNQHLSISFEERCVESKFGLHMIFVFVDILCKNGVCQVLSFVFSERQAEKISLVSIHGRYFRLFPIHLMANLLFILVLAK